MNPFLGKSVSPKRMPLLGSIKTGSLVLVLVGALVALISVLRKNASDRSSVGPIEMSPDKARAFVEAWGDSIYTALDELTFLSDGSFYGTVGSADFEYSAKKRILSSRGLLDLDGDGFIGLPKLVAKLDRAGKRESQTMAGGYFLISPEKIERGEKPTFDLVRDFSDASIGAAAFVEATQELMNASTYWRIRRQLEVMDTPEEELIRQAEERRKK